MSRLLFVHAHPDDETLTCGITMAHHVALGDEVHVLTCTLGEEGEVVPPELADVLDYLAVGAVAVQVGTAIFADPTLPVRLVDELAATCRTRGLTSHRPLIGTALPKRTSAPSSKGVEYRP